MDWNSLCFVAFPYIALSLAVGVTVYRSIHRPFSLSSLSSQLLERKKLYWGSIPFHWGITIILAGHLVALLFPQSILWWNGEPLRLYLLEISGLALGLWALIGLLVLLWRRLSVRRILAVTTPMDLVILALLLVSVTTGLITASFYRFGSNWFTGLLTPYLWSILTFRPNPVPLETLPLIIKLHVFNFFLLAAVFPFSRLVHFITLPIGYLLRPWQIVIWLKRPRRIPALSGRQSK